MEILNRRRFTKPPRVSFVLLDWSCRESLHTLDYLADQDVPRDRYEILWIEYFHRRAPELRQRLIDARADGLPAPVDTWIVMEMPDDVCHHKHLMYNIGIVASQGELVCFCDSDAMVRPGFVRSILEAFERDPEIVLHHDEVRNRSPHFHPFRYPTFNDVLGPGCNNWVNGRTVGLWDVEDPLHTRNYGACMTARREDLITIGGADMHPDYLGHVCGPYELTFRLINARRREVWNSEEFLYHTWHPGQAGSVDYCGPHDGRHMSTTALEAIRSGRVLPLEENPAIEAIRTRTATNENLATTLEYTVKQEWLKQWAKSCVANLAEPAATTTKVVPSAFDRRLTAARQILLLPLVMRMLARQYRTKYDKLRHASPAPAKTSFGLRNRVRNHCAGLLAKLRGAIAFLPAALDYSKYLVRVCWLHLAYLKLRGFRRFIVWGDPEMTAICRRLAGAAKLRVVMCRDVEHIRDSDLPVLVAACSGGRRLRAQLAKLGVAESRMISMI